jgi:hypothetical protein
MNDSGSGTPFGPTSSSFLDSISITGFPIATPVNQTSLSWSVAAGNYWLVAIGEDGFQGGWQVNQNIDNCAYEQGTGWAACTAGGAPGALAAIITSADSTVTPLPAALPLFATGLGVMGFLAKRRMRKSGAAIAA